MPADTPSIARTLAPAKVNLALLIGSKRADGFHEVATIFQAISLARPSPFTNAREDRYGGDIEGRGRFMVELLAALRETIGDGRMLWIRLNGAELMDERGGNTEEECLEFMRMEIGRAHV